jgi:hypothetical protein
MPAPPRHPVGDADRERLIGLLREHYAQGRLDTGELSRRVGMVLTAESAEAAAGALADLPPLVTARPAGRPRRRGHAHAPIPGPGWLPTDERFRDPTTGVLTRVWIDPGDESRHYVPEPDG